MKNAGLIDRTKGLIFVFAMIAVSAAACNKVKNEFPDAAKNNFLDTCEAGKTKSREVCMRRRNFCFFSETRKECV